MAEAVRKSQWDELFRLVKQAGFTPVTEIARQEVPGELLGFDGDTVPALVHKPTQFYFAIGELPPLRNVYGQSHGPFGVAFEPGDQTQQGGQQYLMWNEVVRACGDWLVRVKEDSGPDLWELAAQERTLLAPSGGGGLENTPFTSAERRHVEKTLDEVLIEVRRTQELTGEQTRLLAAMIADVKEAATRFGRKDWMLLLYGSLINLVTQAAFAPEQARDLMRLIGQGLELRWFVEHGVSLRDGQSGSPKRIVAQLGMDPQRTICDLRDAEVDAHAG